MTNRECFLEEIKKFFAEKNIDITKALSEEANIYWEELLKGKASIGGMTEMGEKILRYMLDNENKYPNGFSSKNIGEGLFTSSRAVAGSIRKLITDGYVEKIGKEPVIYMLTNIARSWNN